MDTRQAQQIEKIADESAKHARLATQKSDELQALISLIEYKSGKKNPYSSVGQLFKKLGLS